MKKEENKQITKQLHAMDAILVFLFACMVTFIVVMVGVFLRMGSVPDTLIVSVFAFFGLECGVMGWIKTAKTGLEEKLERASDEEMEV